MHSQHGCMWNIQYCTKLSVQEVVKQPCSLRHIAGKVYNACKCAFGGGVSTEKDHDANVVYPNVSSVSKQEVPMTCLTQHHMPVQSTI